MSKRKDGSTLNRRGLLKGATVASLAALGSSQAMAQAPARPAQSNAPTPADAGRPRELPIVQDSCGSDYMADVIKSLGIEHVACNPGNSFRGLHESLINYLKIDW